MALVRRRSLCNLLNRQSHSRISIMIRDYDFMIMNHDYVLCRIYNFKRCQLEVANNKITNNFDFVLLF
jgi:hypothetical protein